MAAFFPIPLSLKLLSFLFPLLAVGIFAALSALELRTGSRAFAMVRDWAALAFTLTAYRQMDWFTPAVHDGRLEAGWIVWDRTLLYDYGFKAAIEGAGIWLPSLLELSYLVVYLSAPFALAVLYLVRKPQRTHAVLLFYVTGTLLAYACFPWFPSEPPRTAFPGTDVPMAAAWVRKLNLFVVGGYGIHSSVFPSAHVSSALCAAFGLICALPERTRIGRAMLVYAAVVTVATVYGRYHYAVDAVAGVLAALVTRYAILRYSRNLCGGGT